MVINPKTELFALSFIYCNIVISHFHKNKDLSCIIQIKGYDKD